MTVRFVVIDLECTSREPTEAHVVEWAAVMFEPQWFSHGGVSGSRHALVKPPIPIPPETSAIHHIIDADVAHAWTWDIAQADIIDLMQDDPEYVAVAHNANYERTVLASLNLKCRWLCTYKAALRVWPDAPGHSNECLRYWLGLGTGRRGNQKPHSALHDAEVTAQILEALLQAATDPEAMIKWTDEPALLPRCPLGDWRGHPWAEVETSFLEWILRKIHDRDDVRFCAQTELDRRESEYRREAQKIAHGTATADDDCDIPF